MKNISRPEVAIATNDTSSATAMIFLNMGASTSSFTLLKPGRNGRS